MDEKDKTQEVQETQTDVSPSRKPIYLIKRGVRANADTAEFQVGEPLYCKDTHELFFGGEDGKLETARNPEDAALRIMLYLMTCTPLFNRCLPVFYKKEHMPEKLMDFEIAYCLDVHELYIGIDGVGKLLM